MWQSGGGRNWSLPYKNACTIMAETWGRCVKSAGAHELVTKRYHEFRDPIHGFITLDSDERRVLDSAPVQRLRHIHQLAMSYLVYPGATHKRFEHSLGVMELAGRVYDVVTAQDNIHESFRRTVLNFTDDERTYWRKVLRMAALCHDIGHLPFSHAAEGILPQGETHESITAELIQGDPMAAIWASMTPPLRSLDIAKVAVGPEKLRDQQFTEWERLLYEIIGGDALGVDRMDYLLRDSHHAGVAYGRFDHYRLIEAMRILPASPQTDTPALGVEAGGIHSTEALLLARYFMFMQVYYHHVRVAYDLHLEQFLKEWLPGGQFPEGSDGLELLTDNQVLSAITASVLDVSSPGHAPASRIVNRGHFRRAYTLTPNDAETYEDPVSAIAEACENRFGDEAVLQKSYRQSDPATEFPVSDSQGYTEPSLAWSTPLRQIPIVDVGYVLVDPANANDARDWIRSEKDSILSQATDGE